MSHQFQRTGLALDGFLVDSVEITGESVQILLRSRSPSGLCPSCGRPSRRVQSRYLRRPADLPLCGRRTQWMETIVHYLGLALGGRPAAAFVERLMVPVSNDTLLRVVRRRTADQNDELTVIGIDDFAFRRGQTYGTIICDLKRRRPVTLLPDRALDTSRAWLAVHQSISIVARDRGGGYGEVIAKALPDAEQVADRWHLMENSSRALLDAVGNSMRQIRQAIGSNVVDPKLLTYAERLQYEGYLRRQETNEAIQGLAKEGLSIRQIVRQTGDSRKLVRNVLRGQRLDVFRTKPSSLDSWLPWLNTRWEEGARNALAVWREMKAKSFPGQSGVVSQWVQRRRLAEKVRQTCAHALVAAIEVNVPELVAARKTIGDFQSMNRSKSAAKLDGWLETARDSQIGSFVGGVEKHLDAVRNAIVSPWSNGQTEGQITRLKLIKRQMYGRAKLDLLQARLIGTS